MCFQSPHIPPALVCLQLGLLFPHLRACLASPASSPHEGIPDCTPAMGDPIPVIQRFPNTGAHWRQLESVSYLLLLGLYSRNQFRGISGGWGLSNFILEAHHVVLTYSQVLSSWANLFHFGTKVKNVYETVLAQLFSLIFWDKWSLHGTITTIQF